MAKAFSGTLKQIRRLAAQRKVCFTLKALRELANLEIGLDAEDACDVLASLKPADFVGRVRSKVTGERMYILKPVVAEIVLYVKVILRDDCLVVSFHEDEGADEQDP